MELQNSAQGIELDYPQLIRKGHLAEKIVIVNGQPGCGKTMLSPIVAAMERVELLTFAYEVEHICELYYLGKITSDAAAVMMRLMTDLKLYNLMMSRETNFRFSDQSSIFSDQKPFKYIKRLFQKGDQALPQRIKKESPILHLTTHNLLPISEPLFSGLGSRLVFIEVVRHPLYQVKQQALNMESLIGTARCFGIHFNHNGHQLPFYVYGFEELFLKSNSVERAIYSMDKLNRRAENARKRLIEKYKAKIIVVPFELFVTNPWPYLEKIAQALGTKITKSTRKMMKKQNVPRKIYAQGVPLKIYKRCGWEPPKPGSDENKEFVLRREFVKEKGVSRESLNLLDQLCAEYEKKYLGGKRKGYEKI